MKRSSELAVLSREHHVALELALRLQRATGADAAAVRRAALEFWRDEGSEHFRLEEELLLPAFARHAGADDADVVRVLVEHTDIRRRIADLEDDATTDAEALNALGVLLRDHVRHEERTLFGRVEAALTAAELDAVGAALEAAGDGHRPPRA
ncbi:MAG: hemerythrin domain-containing protein [Solirubrobacteraceae bacterium]